MSKEVIKLKGKTFFKTEHRNKVQEAVYVAHDITHRASILLKDYYLYKDSLIPIDDDLIKLAFDVVQSSSTKTSPPLRESKQSFPKDEKEAKKFAEKKASNLKKKDTFAEMKHCYERLFDTYVNSKLSLSYILFYKRQELETAYLNNIIFHYTKYITKLLRLEFDFSSKEAKTITYKIITRQDLPQEILEWCEITCPSILEDRNGKFLETYMETKPWTFFREMVLMTKRAETYIQENPENRKKFYNPFPMVSSFIPSHIHLDTSGIVQLLLEDVDDFKKHYKLMYGIDLNVTGKDNILKSFESITGIKDPDGVLGAEHNTRIWKYLCNFDSKKYKNILRDERKDMTVWAFDNSITTDGVSASFHIIDEKEKRKKKRQGRKAFTKKKKEFMTLDDLSNEDLEEVLNSKKIAGDPGKVNIGVFTDGQNTFSYTSQKRRYDMKSKLFVEKRAKLSEALPKEYRDALSATFSRSLDRQVFETYVKAKFSMPDQVLPVYRKTTFRSYKFTSYCLKKSSEAKTINDLKKWVATAHDPEIKHPWMTSINSPVMQEITKNIHIASKKPIIFYGNGGKNGNNLKGTQAAPNIGFERLLKKHFRLVEVPETLTSQTCPCCRGVKVMEKQKFEDREYPEERHQLLRCKNVNCLSRWWSRDILGSFNILYKTIETILQKTKGVNLSR